MELQHTRALVTGGASGMGRAFVTALAEAGAQVAFCDLNPDAVAQTEAELAHLPGTVKGFVANVAVEAEVEAMLDAAWSAFGSLNAVINNAGIFRDALLVKKDRHTGEVHTMSLAQWQAVIDVDLTGPFLITRGFAARAVRDDVRPGCIVNISSVARHGNRGQSNYSAAKAGLVADTKLWAEELARYGLRVGAIAPGFVRTPILDGMKPEALEMLVRAVPLGRVGEAHEMWQAVRFILECDYFTGRCIDVDGGLSL